MPETNSYLFPESVAELRDANRLARELSVVNEQLLQQKLKSQDETTATSQELKDVFKVNELDIAKEEDRQLILSWLKNARKQKAIINVSLAAEASHDFILKLSKWFRKEVDPNCLIVMGLDPAIGIGTIVRTTNKVFDLSLKSKLKNSKDILLSEIKKMDVEPANG